MRAIGMCRVVGTVTVSVTGPRLVTILPGSWTYRHDQRCDKRALSSLSQRAAATCQPTTDADTHNDTEAEVSYESTRAIDTPS